MVYLNKYRLPNVLGHGTCMLNLVRPTWGRNLLENLQKLIPMVPRLILN
jgi:hypothetical protein